MMKISLILEAVNRVTGPVRGIVDSVKKMGSQITATARQVGGRLMYMGDQARDAAYHFRGPVRDIIGNVKKMGAQVSSTAREIGGRLMYMGDQARDAAHHFVTLAGPEGMARAAKSAEYFKRQVSGLTSGLTILKYASMAAIVGIGEEFVRGVFKAGGETQTMMVTLTRLEGSADRARKALTWMQNFSLGPGAKFEMPDVMRSYQMAKNFGMNPQGGSLAAFADLASGERVPLKQVLIAVKDAMEGTSTRPIANLGIKMKQGKGGGPNSYLYSNLAGQFVTEHSAKTPEATLAKLVEIINKKYAGLATLQAKTVDGGIAQLHKFLYLFEMKVANAGVFDWALKQMNRFFAWVKQATADGSIDRLAKQISNFMTGTGDKVIAFISKTDWHAVATDLKALAVSLGLVAGAINVLATLGGGGLSGLFNAMIVGKILGMTSALMGLAPVLSATMMLLFGLDVAAGPITLVILAIGALIAIGYLLWANWDKISGWFKGLWNGMPNWLKVAITAVLFVLNPFLGAVAIIMQAWSPLTGFFKRLWGSIKNVFTNDIPKLADMMPPWMKIGAGALLGAPLGPAGMALGASWASHQGTQPAPAGKQPPHAAHVTVELTGDGARGARVTRLQSSDPNFALHVKRGPVTAGF